jgi:protein-S-isoprenylcysteine O-methyltransferase Ste14
LASIGRRIFHRRMHVGLLVVALATLTIRSGNLFGRHAVVGNVLSLLLVLAGLALRAWAGGIAGSHTRKASIEAPRLATGGPYAYVRNPIYLASIVLGLGMVGLLGDVWMLLPYIAVFIFLYTTIVTAEEEFLRGQFGAAYAHYCAHVPRLLPRLRPPPDATAQPYDTSALFGEARLGLVLFGIYVVMRGGAAMRMRYLGF